MKEFILDVNVDLKTGNPGCPEYFLRDLRSHKKIGLVRGGAKYNAEVGRKGALLDLFNEMLRTGKVRTIPDDVVDAKESDLMLRLRECLGTFPAECNDIHIFALSSVSSCLNIVSNDIGISTCRDLIRNRIGHQHCPAVRLIRSQQAYDDS